jgi:hypothetical protein
LHEDRQKIAGELEASVIDTIIDLERQIEATHEESTFEYELMLDILAFLRFFKGQTWEKVDDPQQSESFRLKWGQRPGITPKQLCDALCQHKFIDMPNAKLFQAILEDYKGAIEHQPAIDWQGTLDSITTFMIVGQYLGILNPETAPSRNRVLLDDKFGKDRYPVPPAASIINRCFTVNGKEVEVSTISRHHAKPIILDLETLELRVKGLYETFNLGEKDGDNLSWDDIVINLPKLLEDSAVSKDELLANLDQIDIGVLKFFGEMMAQSIKDRGEVASRLASST